MERDEKLEAGLGRRFQRKSRAMVEKCIGECEGEFLRFFRSRGFREGRTAPAYGENRLTVTDSRESVTLHIENDPEVVWSGPPRLKIEVLSDGVLRSVVISITRHFPAAGPDSSLTRERLQQLIEALPEVQLSFTLNPGGQGKARTFTSFAALLTSLGIVS